MLAIQTGEEPGLEARTSAGEPPTCPLCGDVEFVPAAVCDDFEERGRGRTTLALRCSRCASVVLHPPLLGHAHRPRETDAAPAWLRPSSECRLAERCCRSQRAPARIVLVDASSAQRARLRSCLPPTQTIDTVDREQVARLPAGSVDLVMLIRSLEYVSDPVTILQALRSALLPGGRIIVVGNHLDAIAFALFGGRHWAGYDVPRQRTILSRRAHQQLAAHAGLEIESTTTFRHPAMWAESSRRWLEDWGAPGWLSARFAPRAILSAAAAGLIEAAAEPLGRAGLLLVTLRRPAEPARP